MSTTPKRAGRTDRRFRAVAAGIRMRAAGTACPWCGGVLDPREPAGSDDAVEVDHDPPLSALLASGRGHLAAHESVLTAMHRGCNLEKGTQPMANAPARRTSASRVW